MSLSNICYAVYKKFIRSIFYISDIKKVMGENVSLITNVTNYWSSVRELILDI